MIKASNISKRRSSALKEGSAEYLAKRAELLAIAANQFKTKGYRSAKLAEIGLKAGLDRATVYYYFGSKEELFRECLRSGVEANIKQCVRIFEESSRTASERLKDIMEQLMRAYSDNFPKIDRKSVVWGKSVSVSVGLGGRV